MPWASGASAGLSRWWVGLWSSWSLGLVLLYGVVGVVLVIVLVSVQSLECGLLRWHRLYGLRGLVSGVGLRVVPSVV